MINPDILRKIGCDYGQEKKSMVLAMLEDFTMKFAEIYKDKPGSRIIRCILQLSEGKEEKLTHYIQAALEDWRDVILWAEYDKNDNKIFDGNKKFAG
ncbi:MAG: hypothetical protein ACFFD4_18020 [Candidatus Odinarchaeota archaeon]